MSEIKIEKLNCPGCGKPMRLLGTGYRVNIFKCPDCKINKSQEKTTMGQSDENKEEQHEGNN